MLIASFVCIERPAFNASTNSFNLLSHLRLEKIQVGAQVCGEDMFGI